MTHIDIVFDGPPGPEGGRFVEVENDKGASIGESFFGKWVQRPDGYWCLRTEIAAERDALKRDIACRPGSLDLLYRIRAALGFNSYYPLSHLDDQAKRLRTDALALAQEVIREYENLEDDAPMSDECGQCTTFHMPHKRTCAYHQAKAIVGRER